MLALLLPRTGMRLLRLVNAYRYLGPTTTNVADRQERPKPFPLTITQSTSSHAHINHPGTEQSHDRPDSS